MDEIFEQMLSTTPWGDGSGVNRTTWDGVAGGSTMPNHLTTDSASNLHGLQGPSTVPPMQLVGGSDSQGLGQEANRAFEAAPQQTNQRPTSHTQSMIPQWQQQSYIGGMPPPAPVPMVGKMESFALPADVSREISLGKRPRDKDIMFEDQAGNMLPMLQNQSMQPSHVFGDQGTLSQDPVINGVIRPRVRARRGQATDPHSIAERNRRERIAERMKALQELVPDSNKTDKASMLDEIIGYVKFLQMQVKCLSMCRLGSASGAAPLLGDLPAEGPGSLLANLTQPNARPGASQDSMAFAERQVARLMDEDMSAAMQYLQSKGLCLMPISLASAISGQPSTSGPDTLKQAMELQAAAAATVGSSGASIMGTMAFNGSSISQADVSKLMPADNDRSSLQPNDSNR